MSIMRLARPLRRILPRRQFTSTASKRSNVPTNEGKQSMESSKNGDGTIQNLRDNFLHKVSDFDRRILVWVKRYPNAAAVPEFVTPDCILTARSKARIKTCHYMMVLAVIGFVWSIYSGKRDLAAGKTIQKKGEDWHRRIAEQAAQERAASELAKAKSD